MLERTGQLPHIKEAQRQMLANIPFTGNSFLSMMIALDLPEKPAGLRMLDVGSGASDLTAVLIALGADAYATDPIYSSSDAILKAYEDAGRLADPLTFQIFAKSRAQHPERYKPFFASDMSEFPDNHFDEVSSMLAVIGHLDTDWEVLTACLEELVRVTQIEGKIRLSPINMFGKNEGEQRKMQRTQNQLRIFDWLDQRSGYLEYGTIPALNVGPSASTLIIEKLASPA
ncbi:MAG TPA: hypothetical protein VLE91_02115 [Candidatus Saccharimonadales bacterium]|nr:hypothetical protein [Candidatus Saccharimonadales bacterium]